MFARAESNCGRARGGAKVLVEPRLYLLVHNPKAVAESFLWGPGAFSTFQRQHSLFTTHSRCGPSQKRRPGPCSKSLRRTAGRAYPTSLPTRLAAQTATSSACRYVAHSSFFTHSHANPLKGSRCYYVRESLANLATSVARDALLSLGICLGKFTKTGKFRLHITALSVIAPHARYKVWVKANGEMPFLYGGNVLKAHVGRWSEDCPEHQGVVVLSMNDTPLGFGVSARSTAEARKLDPTGVVTFRQADVGEYLREEDTLFTT